MKDAPETNDFIKIGSQRFPLGELKSRQEVLDYLRENGASHTALMDICEEYREKYQNELCWYYPTTDELHLGTFLLLVKEDVYKRQDYGIRQPCLWPESWRHRTS